ARTRAADRRPAWRPTAGSTGRRCPAALPARPPWDLLADGDLIVPDGRLQRRHEPVRARRKVAYPASPSSKCHDGGPRGCRNGIRIVTRTDRKTGRKTGQDVGGGRDPVTTAGAGGR